MLRYELLTDDDRNTMDGPYFAIDPKTGTVNTLRTLTDVPARTLPFRLVVTARDNPGATNPADYNTAQTHVVVSIIITVIIDKTPVRAVLRPSEVPVV